MATIKKLIQDAPRMRGSLPVKAKKGANVKKAQAGVKVPVKRKVDYPGYRPPRIPSDSLPKNEGSIRNIKKLYDDGIFDDKKSEKS